MFLSFGAVTSNGKKIVLFHIPCMSMSQVTRGLAVAKSRVATNSGISLNVVNSEFSGNFVQPQGKIVIKYF